jgi:hypothetical protein
MLSGSAHSAVTCIAASPVGERLSIFGVGRGGVFVGGRSLGGEEVSGSRSLGKAGSGRGDGSADGGCMQLHGSLFLRLIFAV